MAAATVEERSTTNVKTLQKISNENRPNKIVKRLKEKKNAKGLDIDVLIEAAESKSPGSEDTQDSKDKRAAQGIVIDGRTYTCATCKTGHRVGICKHAKERPMTATHPPGRPPAGAPKKVICDCPKQCSCKKKDCKCARKCSCTQMMYMLVYIPAPGEQEDVDEEQGTWKLGKQVTTDLKGNVLTEEQIRERQEQKEAQKGHTPEKRVAVLSTPSLKGEMESIASKTDLKPKAEGGCCKHKEKVSLKKIVEEASPQSGRVSKSAVEGCNCGQACECAFCPQHPNNFTSRQMAKQQFLNFANQPYHNQQQMITPFLPTTPQEASCMGGMPQFAFSRLPQRPSQFDMQQAFPGPGLILSYPVTYNDLYGAGHPMAPFLVPQNFPFVNGMVENGGMEAQIPVSTAQSDLTHSDLSHLQYTSEEFEIGQAYVNSAGPGDWGSVFATPAEWPAMGAVATPLVNELVGQPEHLTQTVQDQNNISNPFDSTFTFPGNSAPLIHDTAFDSGTNITEAPHTHPQPIAPTVRPCCAGGSNDNFMNDIDDHVFNQFTTPF